MIVLVAAVTFVEVVVDAPSGRQALQLGIGIASIIVALTSFLYFGNHGNEKTLTFGRNASVAGLPKRADAERRCSVVGGRVKDSPAEDAPRFLSRTPPDRTRTAIVIACSLKAPPRPSPPFRVDGGCGTPVTDVRLTGGRARPRPRRPQLRDVLWPRSAEGETPPTSSSTSGWPGVHRFDRACRCSSWPLNRTRSVGGSTVLRNPSPSVLRTAGDHGAVGRLRRSERRRPRSRAMGARPATSLP